MNGKLQTSNTPIYAQVVSIFFVGLMIFVITGSILRLINDFVKIDISALTILVRVLVLFGTLLAMFLALIGSKKSTYELTEDAIVISSAGLFSKKKIYRFKNVNSLTMKQSAVGRRYNYGDVVINMDRLENNVEVVLKAVDNPDGVVTQINDHLSH